MVYVGEEGRGIFACALLCIPGELSHTSSRANTHAFRVRGARCINARYAHACVEGLGVRRHASHACAYVDTYVLQAQVGQLVRTAVSHVFAPDIALDAMDLSDEVHMY